MAVSKPRAKSQLIPTNLTEQEETAASISAAWPRAVHTDSLLGSSTSWLEGGEYLCNHTSTYYFAGSTFHSDINKFFWPNLIDHDSLIDKFLPWVLHKFIWHLFLNKCLDRKQSFKCILTLQNQTPELHSKKPCSWKPCMGVEAVKAAEPQIIGVLQLLSSNNHTIVSSSHGGGSVWEGERDTAVSITVCFWDQLWCLYGTVNPKETIDDRLFTWSSGFQQKRFQNGLFLLFWAFCGKSIEFFYVLHRWLWDINPWAVLRTIVRLIKRMSRIINQGVHEVRPKAGVWAERVH